jgi:DNA (cytosine-5)-methyltransferase 1
MKGMKILNLYAGIGGNRKYWRGHEITAVEINSDIAKIYQDFFPNDKVIIADAHEYLLQHYKEYDFIWSSPPCPTHSRLQVMSVLDNTRGNKNRKAIYPDMKLYEEIILLSNFVLKNTKWIIENVIPYYEYLINPSIILGRHPFWSNFYIDNIKIKGVNIKGEKEIHGNDSVYGFNIIKYNIDNNMKRKILRNLVNPEIGLYILNQAMNIKDDKQMELFK